MNTLTKLAGLVVALVAVVSIGLRAQATPPEQIALTAARSTVVATDFDITRIAVTDPAIADAVVVAPREVLIDGKSPGTVSLISWGDRKSVV